VVGFALGFVRAPQVAHFQSDFNLWVYNLKLVSQLTFQPSQMHTLREERTVKSLDLLDFLWFWRSCRTALTFRDSV
jgi:hypothetical protein